MYYYKEDKNYVIYDHASNNLPINGWLHNCIFCCAISSRLIDYKYKHLDLLLLICKDCKIDDKENLIKKIVKSTIPKYKRKISYII